MADGQALPRDEFPDGAFLVIDGDSVRRSASWLWQRAPLLLTLPVITTDRNNER